MSSASVTAFPACRPLCPAAVGVDNFVQSGLRDAVPECSSRQRRCHREVLRRNAWEYFWMIVIRPIVLTLLLAPLARAEAPATYTNPLPTPEQIADPFVFREGDTYYLYGTAARDGLLVWTSSDLVNWQPRGHAFKRTDDGWARRDFWAPELFKHRDKYYLHFTANGGDRQKPVRRLVLAEGDSPLGPFREVKAPWFDASYDTIDGHVLRDSDGQLYLYSVYLPEPPQ